MTGARTLDALQKRWLTARVDGAMEAAWCELPGPSGELGERHAFTRAAGDLHAACQQLRDEADREAAVLVAAALGADVNDAIAAIEDSDFDAAFGWRFTMGGTAYRLDRDAGGSLVVAPGGEGGSA